MGTRGDIQPYIYLARALKKNGHDVKLGSHPCWRKLIEESGISFLPVGPDIDIEMEAAVIRGKSKNAMEISNKIRTEGGVSEAVQLIESVI